MARGTLAIAGATFAVLASYPGSAQDDWKTAANARIEQIRKRDAQIVVVDRDGIPVAGLPVDVDQRRHRFAFGTAVSGSLLSDEHYRRFFYGHFEWAVLENDSKWMINEPWRDFETYARADAILSQLEQHGIRVRGHCLFWAKEEYVPPWARELPDGELQAEIDERIDHAVPHFGERFLHWDVNNEMLDGHFFDDHLGPDINAYMFRRTHELHPAARLFTNDYNIIAGSEARTQSYIDQVRGLIARGAPVHAVGVQGHFWGDTVDPLQILARLDQLSVLGLPVWVTEYDAVDSNAVRRADKLENLYRAAFSHPTVEGILMWGFWAGSHWRGEDAAIVDLDWTVNAAGERYGALISEWTTHAAGASDPDGVFGFRGFHGSYRVTVQPPVGDPVLAEIELEPGDGVAAFLVPLVPGSCFPASEVRDLALREDAQGTALAWSPLPRRSDMSLAYDVLRASDPSGFAEGACVESAGADESSRDDVAPPAGSAFHYLVRGVYGCPEGRGSLGSASDGTPRQGRACP